MNTLTIETTTVAATLSASALEIINDIVPLEVAFTTSGSASTASVVQVGYSDVSVGIRAGSQSGRLLASSGLWEVIDGKVRFALVLGADAQELIAASDSVSVYVEVTLRRNGLPDAKYFATGSASDTAASTAVYAHDRSDTAHGIRRVVETGSPAANGAALVEALATPGVVYLGVDCLLSDTLIIKAGTKLIGTGGAIIRAAANFGDKALVRNETRNPATGANMDSDITISNITLDGNKAANTSGIESSPCIQFYAVMRGAVENCTIKNPKGDGVIIGGDRNTQTIQSEGCRVAHCRIEGAARNGVAITEGASIELDSLSVSGAGLHGIDLECNTASSEIERVRIRSCVVDGGGNGTTSAGIAVDNSNSGTVSDVSVSGSEISDVDGYGIYTRGCSAFSIDRLVVRRSALSGIKQEAHADGVALRITDSIIDTPTGIGVQTSSAGQSVLASVAVRNGSAGGFTIQGASSGDVIRGITAIGCAGIGILIQAKSHAVISGCGSHGNTGRGFYLDGLSYCSIVANSASGNGSVGYEQVSATACVFDHNIDHSNA